MNSAGVRLIAAGWGLFIAENLLLSENRTEIIKEFGEENYHRIYNSLSTFACLSIGYGFLRYRKTSPNHNFFHLSRGSKIAALLSRTVGMVGLAQTMPKLQLPFEEVKSEGNVHLQENTKEFKAKCPIDFNYGNDRKNDPSLIWGMKRVTRHPQLFFGGLTCLSFALTTPLATPLVFWSFPLIFAFIGGSHQDYRHQRGIGGHWTKEYSEKTSLVPFYAFIIGKQKWVDLWAESKGLNALVAIAIAVVTII
jgi:uncharacterized membrane protein